MSTASNILKDLISDLARRGKWDEVSLMCEGQHPADLAEVIHEAPESQQGDLFDSIPEDLKPDVMAELAPDLGAELLESMSHEEASEIVEEMEPDDAADVLGDLDEAQSNLILQHMDAEESDDVRNLLRYEEDTAGGIMTTSLLTFPATFTVEEAISQLALVDRDEPFYSVYIVDENERLVGHITLWDLVRHQHRAERLGDFVQRDPMAAQTDMDQEEVARLMLKYDLTSLPVVDADHRLVGRITVDDVMDVMEEEASEDMMRMAGTTGEALSHTTPLQASRIRLPWLLITLFTGFATSFLFRSFVDSLAEVLVLSFFIPIVLAMGGNTGIQSSTLIIRSIALGNLEGGGLVRMLIREVLVATMMGLICGIIIAGWAMFLVHLTPSIENTFSAPFLGFVVGLSLMIAMMFAAIFGAITPILLDRFDIDPAVASGPFVTSSNDIFALLIYYGVSFGLLHFAVFMGGLAG